VTQRTPEKSNKFIRDPHRTTTAADHHLHCFTEAETETVYGDLDPDVVRAGGDLY